MISLVIFICITVLVLLALTMESSSLCYQLAVSGLGGISATV